MSVPKFRFSQNSGILYIERKTPHLVFEEKIMKAPKFFKRTIAGMLVGILLTEPVCASVADALVALTNAQTDQKTVQKSLDRFISNTVTTYLVGIKKDN